MGPLIRSRSFKSLLSYLAATIALLVTSPLIVSAQCVQAGNNWTCSGNVGTTEIHTAAEANIFTFLDGVSGFIALYSGGGADQLDFSALTVDLHTDLQDSDGAAYTAVSAATDLYISFNEFMGAIIQGGSGNDEIVGSPGADTISGGAGNDHIEGGAGDDLIFGDEGNDDLNGEAGEDVIDGGVGDDDLDGREGNDTLYGSIGSDDINGDEGNDTLYGDEGDDILDGREGDDTAIGGLGDDTLYGDDGVDLLYGDEGADNIEGGADNDTMYGGEGVDEIDGGEDEDTRADTIFTDCDGEVLANIENDTCPDAAPVSPSSSLPPDLCITDGTRVALEGGMLLVFSDFRDTPNGMTVAHIPLSSLRAPTDAEKASGVPIWVGYQDSGFAPGWGAAVYWQADHYGVVVYKDGGQTIYDDTGAVCGWF